MTGPGGFSARPHAGQPMRLAVAAAMRRRCRRCMLSSRTGASISSDRARAVALVVPRSARALAGAEGLEGDDGVGFLDARQDLHLLVDEVADVGILVDVELDQQVVIPRSGIDLRGN